MRARLALAALLALAAPSLAQDDDAPLVDVERDEVTCEQPPSKWKRPSDAWQILDLVALREQTAAAGQDVRALDDVRAQLWFGAAQATIVVRSRPHPSHTPPELAELGQQEAQRYVGAVAEGELRELGGTRLGKRPAIKFEVAGKHQDGRPLLLHGVITYRAEDNQIFTVVLDVPADSSALKQVEKDFKAFLKKAKV